MKPDLWEVIVRTDENPLDRTERLKVPGGWLYRSVIWNIEGQTVAMVFVAKRWWMR